MTRIKKTYKNLFVSVLVSVMCLSEIDTNGESIKQFATSINLNTNSSLQMNLAQLIKAGYETQFATFAIYAIFLYLLIGKSSLSIRKILSYYKSNVFFSIVSTALIAIFDCYLLIGELVNDQLLANINFTLSLWVILFLKFIGYFFTTTIIVYLITRSLANFRLVNGPSKYTKGWKYFVRILLCWIPYIVILYPGVTTWDTESQMIEFFNIHSYVSGSGKYFVYNTYPIASYLIPNHAISVTNHHNFFVTLFYGFNEKIGLTVFHSSNIGFFLSSLIQALLIIGIMTYSLKVFRKISDNTSLVNRLAWFYAIFPLFPIYSMFLVKNVIYSALVMLFIVMIIDAYFNVKLYRDWRWLLLLFIDVSLQLVSQKYALYVLIFVVFILLFTYHKYWKQILISIFLPIILFKILIEGMMFTNLKVTPGDPVESYGVMLEQTALYIHEYPEDISENEYKVLNKVFDVKKMGDMYEASAEYVDPLKSSGAFTSMGIYKYKTVSKEDIKNYKKVWFEMFLKHPSIYFKAGLNLGYKYLDINSTQPLATKTTNDYAPLWDLSQDFVNMEIKKGKIEATQVNRFKPFRVLIAIVLNIFETIKPLSAFVNGQILLWVSVIMLISSWFISGWKVISVFSIIAFQVPIWMISPLDGDQRYSMPVIFATILFVMFYLLLKERGNNG